MWPELIGWRGLWEDELLSGWDKWKASLWVCQLPAWFSPEAPFIFFRKEATILFLHWDKFMEAINLQVQGIGLWCQGKGQGPGECRPSVAHLISVLSPVSHFLSLLPPLIRSLSWVLECRDHSSLRFSHPLHLTGAELTRQGGETVWRTVKYALWPLSPALWVLRLLFIFISQSQTHWSPRDCPYTRRGASALKVIVP